MSYENLLLFREYLRSRIFPSIIIASILFSGSKRNWIGRESGGKIDRTFSSLVTVSRFLSEVNIELRETIGADSGDRSRIAS